MWMEDSLLRVWPNLAVFSVVYFTYRRMTSPTVTRYTNINRAEVDARQVHYFFFQALPFKPMGVIGDLGAIDECEALAFSAKVFSDVTDVPLNGRRCSSILRFESSESRCASMSALHFTDFQFALKPTQPFKPRYFSLFFAHLHLNVNGLPTSYTRGFCVKFSPFF